jgi:transposase
VFRISFSSPLLGGYDEPEILRYAITSKWPRGADGGHGNILLADRAYDSDRLREDLAAKGAWANVRPMPHRVNSPSFSAWLYRLRNLVERFFNKLKHYRAVATRYDKRDDNYLASVQLASIRIWLPSYESVT